MRRWVVASFLAFSGALLVLLFAFQNPKREEMPLAKGDGAILYRQNCAVCHGVRGAGGIGRPLRGRILPVALIKQIVQRGQNKMPALPHLKGEALEDVARYVNRLR